MLAQGWKEANIRMGLRRGRASQGLEGGLSPRSCTVLPEHGESLGSRSLETELRSDREEGKGAGD